MKPRSFYVVIQEGGSSCEAYACAYDTSEDARDAMIGHARASYSSAGPFEVKAVARRRDGRGSPPRYEYLVAEADLLTLLEAVRTADYEYPIDETPTHPENIKEEEDEVEV